MAGHKPDWARARDAHGPDE